MFDFLQQGSTKDATQYELKSFVTMATYWVPDLPNINGIFGHLQCTIIIFANGICIVCIIQQAYKYVSPSLWLCLAFFDLAVTNILKSSEWELEQSELPWEHNFYSRRCVSYRTISLPSFNSLRCKLAKIALFMYLSV